MAVLAFVHAHPDDEALLTAGTMAKAVAHGHRVILVVATDGAAGLARSDISDLASVRSAELEKSARILGVHRTVNLGFADSGLDGTHPDGFASIDVDEAAALVQAVVDEEQADIVVGYDPSGGYGHPDHVQIHRVCRNVASDRAVRLFEATLPREPIARAVHLAAALHLTPPDFDPSEFDRAWTPSRDITHRVNVRNYLAPKRAAQAAHASQADADDSVRTLQVLGRLPRPVARRLLGTEYYVEVNASAISSTNVGASKGRH